MGAWTSTFMIGISNRFMHMNMLIPINLLYSVRDSNPYYIRERDVT